MRHRSLASVLIVVLALIAAACGGGESIDLVAQSDTGDAADDTTLLPVPDVDDFEPPAIEPGADPAPAVDDPDPEPIGDPVPPADPAPPADPTPTESPERQMVLAALSKTQAEFTSLRATASMTMGGLPDMPGDVTFEMTMAVADSGDSEFSMDLSSFMDAIAADPSVEPAELALLASIFGEPIDVRTVDGVTYMSAGFMSFLVPVDTPWVAFDDQIAGDPQFDMDPSMDPGSFLVLLQGIDDDAQIVGTETVNGVSTTHITGLLSLSEAAAAASEQGADVVDGVIGIDPTGMLDVDAEVFELDIWIGDDGLVHRMTMGVSNLSAFDTTGELGPGAFFELVIDFSDYGADVVVVAPPAEDVTFVDDDLFFG